MSIRKRVITTLISLILAFAMVFTAANMDPVFAAPKKPLVAVADTQKKSAREMVRQLKKWGFRAKWVKTSKINVNRFDGLVIPGGGDVNPRMYHAKRHRLTTGTRIKKDRMQVRLIKKFAKKKKPVLGVCRGMQVINVAYGGTLNQHIGRTHWGGKRIKTRTKKGSWVRKIYGKTETVKCAHHQCVKKLGKGLIATQWAKKGKRIEALEHESLPIYGVQYHPEIMGKAGYKLAKKFRKECLKRR